MFKNCYNCFCISKALFHIAEANTKSFVAMCVKCCKSLCKTGGLCYYLFVISQLQKGLLAGSLFVYNEVMNYVDVVYEMFYEMIVAFAPCIIPLIVIILMYKILGKIFR